MKIGTVDREKDEGERASERTRPKEERETEARIQERRARSFSVSVVLGFAADLIHQIHLRLNQLPRLFTSRPAARGCTVGGRVGGWVREEGAFVRVCRRQRSRPCASASPKLQGSSRPTPFVSYQCMHLCHISQHIVAAVSWSMAALSHVGVTVGAYPPPSLRASSSQGMNSQGTNSPALHNNHGLLPAHGHSRPCLLLECANERASQHVFFMRASKGRGVKLLHLMCVCARAWVGGWMLRR